MSDTQELRAIANELIDVLERHAEVDPTVRLRAAQFATTTFQQLHNIPLGALLNIPTGTQST